MYIYIYMYLHIYIYIYIYVHVRGPAEDAALGAVVGADAGAAGALPMGTGP